MTRWRPIAATILSVCGLGLSAFLTWGHYFDQKAITNSCPGGTTGGVVDCGKVTSSAQSYIFHVPVALYGLVFFVFMVAINLPVAWRSRSAWVARLRVISSVAGMGMVIYLISMEAFVIHSICIYCSTVHLLQFALFILVVTGWYDTGWASSAWDEEYDEDLDEDLEDAEPEPILVGERGNRPPRGKARRQAGALRA